MVFYSMRVVVLVFIIGTRIKENIAPFHFKFPADFFSRCFIQNWEEIESLKN